MNTSIAVLPADAAAGPASGSTADPGAALIELRSQFDRLLRAVVLLAVMLAAVLVVELWQCWRLRPGAQQAGRIRYNLQQIATTVEEFRQVAAPYPELVALGRKFGVEPLSTPAATSPSTPSPARP